MEISCKYNKCRHETEKNSDYCKYHLRMIEIENSMSKEFRELYEKMKKERYP